MISESEKIESFNFPECSICHRPKPDYCPQCSPMTDEAIRRQREWFKEYEIMKMEELGKDDG